MWTVLAMGDCGEDNSGILEISGCDEFEIVCDVCVSITRFVIVLFWIVFICSIASLFIQEPWIVG